MSKNGLWGAIPEAQKRYESINIPVKFISFFDDDIAPKKAATAIYKSYGSQVKTHTHFTPQQLGVKAIGHFNFFRSRFSFLWPQVEEWFEGKSFSELAKKG